MEACEKLCTIKPAARLPMQPNGTRGEEVGARGLPPVLRGFFAALGAQALKELSLYQQLDWDK